MNKVAENVQYVSSMVNNMCFSEKEFCKLFSTEHRTLPQSFTRLCVEWLKTCASEEYQFDPRNEDSHIVAKQMIEAYDGRVLGFI